MYLFPLPTLLNFLTFSQLAYSILGINLVTLENLPFGSLLWFTTVCTLLALLLYFLQSWDLLDWSVVIHKKRSYLRTPSLWLLLYSLLLWKKELFMLVLQYAMVHFLFLPVKKLLVLFRSSQIIYLACRCVKWISLEHIDAQLYILKFNW